MFFYHAVFIILIQVSDVSIFCYYAYRTVEDVTQYVVVFTCNSKQGIVMPQVVSMSFVFAIFCYYTVVRVRVVCYIGSTCIFNNTFYSDSGSVILVCLYQLSVFMQFCQAIVVIIGQSADGSVTFFYFCQVSFCIVCVPVLSILRQLV